MTQPAVGVQRQIQVIRARHQDHAGNPSPLAPCDACTLLVLYEKARESMARVQDMVSKAQFDPAAYTALLKAGMGG